MTTRTQGKVLPWDNTFISIRFPCIPSNTFSYLLEFSTRKISKNLPVKLVGYDQFSSESRTIDIELFEIVELMGFDDDEMISIYHNFIVFYEFKKKVIRREYID